MSQDLQRDTPWPHAPSVRKNDRQIGQRFFNDQRCDGQTDQSLQSAADFRTLIRAAAKDLNVILQAPIPVKLDSTYSVRGIQFQMDRTAKRVPGLHYGQAKQWL